jgi:hypothetical protein
MLPAPESKKASAMPAQDNGVRTLRGIEPNILHLAMPGEAPILDKIAAGITPGYPHYC